MLLLAQICTKSFVGPHWGSLQPSPDPVAGIGVGSPREREGGWERERKDGRGREGRESRNAQIQSWQAYRPRISLFSSSVPDSFYLQFLFLQSIYDCIGLLYFHCCMIYLCCSPQATPSPRPNPHPQLRVNWQPVRSGAGYNLRCGVVSDWARQAATNSRRKIPYQKP